MSLVTALTLVLSADPSLLLLQMGQEAEVKCTIALNTAQMMKTVKPEQALSEAAKTTEAAAVRDELDAHLTSDAELGPRHKAEIARFRDRLTDCIRDAELLKLEVLRAGASKSPEARKQAVAAHEAYLVRYAGHRTVKAVQGWLKDLTAAP
ncbi:MAG: hypothetical protein ACOZQL_12290 [Myxococcota bacterium]